MSDPTPLPWHLRLLIALPGLALLAVVVDLGLDLWTLQRLADPAWIASRVDAVDARRVPRTEPLQIAPVHPAAEGRVWLFGSSSIAVPHPDHFNQPFAEALSRRGRTLQFDNHGWEGMPSWNVLERVDQALALGDDQGILPDLAVVYYGHNDVTYTYTYALDLPAFDAVHGPLWVLSGRAFQQNDPGHTYWMFCHRRSPHLVELAQDLGLLQLTPAHFDPLQERTTRVYREHTDQLLQRFADRGIPVLLVTPIGHLAMRPFGPEASSGALWDAAQDAPTYAERLDLLVAARDAETFTPDMRAKTPMLDDLRRRGPDALDGPAPLTVCDLEALFRAQQRPFDATEFNDPLHFTDLGYDHLTEAIATCVQAALPPAEAPTPAPG